MRVWLHPKEQIGPHSQIGRQGQLLKHDGDAESPGARDGSEGNRASLDGDYTGVERVYSADDLSERGLACAIFTENTVNLPGDELHSDVVQRKRRAKFLAQSAHLQKRRRPGSGSARPQGMRLVAHRKSTG